MIADRLRAAILQAAISGRLTDQRPEDGTAKELLEQIAAERAVLVKAKKLQKQKALQPVTEESQPFVLPASWAWVRFQDVNQFRIGKTPKRAEPKFWSSSDVPWVAISDMTQGGTIASTKEGVSAAAIAECFGCQPSPAGTLIMSFKLTIGRCSFLARDAVHNEAIVSIFPAVSAGESFSTYLSHALPLLSQLGDSKAAIKGNTLNSESIANLPIPLPPPMEQERIIAKLDEVLPIIDQLAELEREREYLDREFATAIERAILQAAISGKLTKQLPEDGTATELLEIIKTERQQLEEEGKIKKQKPLPPVDTADSPFDIPENWQWSRLGELFSVKSGKATSLEAQSILYSVPVYGGNGIAGYTSSAAVPSDTLVIGRVGFYCGCVHITRSDAWISDNALEVTAHSQSMPVQYWQHLLSYLNLGQTSVSTAQPVVSGKRMYPVAVPVPPAAEQVRIVGKLNETLPLARAIGELVS